MKTFTKTLLVSASLAIITAVPGYATNPLLEIAEMNKIRRTGGLKAAKVDVIGKPDQEVTTTLEEVKGGLSAAGKNISDTVEKVKDYVAGGAATSIKEDVKALRKTLSQNTASIKDSVDALDALTGNQAAFHALHQRAAALNPGDNGALEGAGTLVDGNVGAAAGAPLGGAIADLANADDAGDNVVERQKALLAIAYRRIVNSIDGGNGDTQNKAAYVARLTALNNNVAVTEDNFTLTHLVDFLLDARFK